MIDKLNERITIQQSKHMTDKVGNHRNAWVDYYTCFAYASTFEAQEDEGEVTAEQKSVVFTVRWCSEVNKLTSTGFRVVAITNAEAEAQKTSIAADAQAEANRKIAESLSDTLIEYQKIQKWDGKLPTVSGSNALVSIDPAE